MEKWHKTGCVLCAQNCGLEVKVENNRIVKVRPDRQNPRSKGYVCRKGINIAHHQHHAQRLTHPLKRVGEGFEQISWDQAIDEIAARLKEIVGEHGPRSFAYMGGGGQGCHFEAAFGVPLMRGLGSRYHYNALAQELTGLFWAWKQATGRQFLISDHDQTDVLLAIGWNGMMSHQMPRARKVLMDFAKDPGKVLVVIDPRRSETAAMADIHLPLRPGTDALLTRAMIAVILNEGWENAGYIRDHVAGFDQIRSLFEDFDFRAAIDVCRLDYGQVREVCRLTATRQSSMHPDLGVLMNRHSTVTSALEIILMAVCGRIGVPGGNIVPGSIPLATGGGASGKSKGEEWKTVITGFPALSGYYPPNVMPEEIMNDHPERLRAVLCCGANPLRSYADTTAYEQAFGQLDLLVTCELAMTETAALSHYVLPARSGYESWDATFFAWTYPEIYFQMRRPVVEPEGEPLEVSQILVRLADRLGLIPEIPPQLYEAARTDRAAYAVELMTFVMSDPRAMKAITFVLAQTLGRELGSANLAALWGLLQTTPGSFQQDAARAGFTPGPEFGEQMFQAILDHPGGLWLGKCDPAEAMKAIKTGDGRIQVDYPDVREWMASITPESEQAALDADSKWPLILMSGRHMDTNANTLMRDPAWNEGRRACSLAMNPADAEKLGLADGQPVKVITEAGEEIAELEITDQARQGQVIIPHGFGLNFMGRVYGPNANRLTKNTHRDRFAGTPLHRYVPCRVEKA
jgi:anaerobic selenocysteine-containing dehydrogenase